MLDVSDDKAFMFDGWEVNSVYRSDVSDDPSDVSDDRADVSDDRAAASDD